ncbi:hypothetical protein C8R44DRAFT_746574 [Mycena epipterygia]|nr:hypothetical protein C8R44DRAFT_746574 [Mycena epipterygia]
MARIFLTLISLVCMFQTLAARYLTTSKAPLHRRAVTSAACDKLNAAIDAETESARLALGPINTANDISSAPLLLQAQLSLLDANNASTQIAFSLLGPEEGPAPADSQARIVAGLQAAQGSLNKIFVFDNATATAIQSANSSISTALVSAQQAVAINCTTTA